MWSVPQIPPIFYESLSWESPYVNHILGYPGIWRGTLDAKAVKINYEMYKAAALAIAGTATPGKLVPSPLDPKVHLEVTHRVARAAMESGVAERQLDDDYFEDTNIKGPFYA